MCSSGCEGRTCRGKAQEKHKAKIQMTRTTTTILGEAKKNVFVAAAWEGIYILGCRLASQRERDALLMVFLTRTATPHRVFLACSAPKQRISAPEEDRKGGQRNRKTRMSVLQANRRKKKKRKKKVPSGRIHVKESRAREPYTVRCVHAAVLVSPVPSFLPFFVFFT